MANLRKRLEAGKKMKKKRKSTGIRPYMVCQSCRTSGIGYSLPLWEEPFSNVPFGMIFLSFCHNSSLWIYCIWKKKWKKLTSINVQKLRRKLQFYRKKNTTISNAISSKKKKKRNGYRKKGEKNYYWKWCLFSIQNSKSPFLWKVVQKNGIFILKKRNWAMVKGFDTMKLFNFFFLVKLKYFLWREMSGNLRKF